MDWKLQTVLWIGKFPAMQNSGYIVFCTWLCTIFSRTQRVVKIFLINIENALTRFFITEISYGVIVDCMFLSCHVRVSEWITPQLQLQCNCSLVKIYDRTVILPALLLVFVWMISFFIDVCSSCHQTTGYKTPTCKNVHCP